MALEEEMRQFQKRQRNRGSYTKKHIEIDKKKKKLQVSWTIGSVYKFWFVIFLAKGRG